MEADSPLRDLPPELILHIFHFLELRDLCSVSRVSKAWRTLARDPMIWRKITLPLLGKMEEVLSQPHITDLRELNVSSIETDTLLFILDRFPNLRSLDLMEAMNIDNFALERIPIRLTRLESLVLARPKQATANLPVLIGNLTRLEHLSIMHCKAVSARSMSAITKNCTRLVSLVLRGCNKLNDTFIEQVPNLRNLQKLDVRGCNISYEAVSRLVSQHMPALKVLHIYLELQKLPTYRDALLSDDAARQLSALKALREILALGDAPMQPIVAAGVVQRMVDMLSASFTPRVRRQAAYAILNFAADEDPSYTQLLISCGVLPKLIELFNVVIDNDTPEFAVWAVSNIIDKGEAARNAAVSAGLLPAAIRLLQSLGLGLELTVPELNSAIDQSGTAQAVAKPRRTHYNASLLQTIIWMLMYCAEIPGMEASLLASVGAVLRQMLTSSDIEQVVWCTEALNYFVDKCTTEYCPIVREWALVPILLDLMHTSARQSFAGERAPCGNFMLRKGVLNLLAILESLLLNYPDEVTLSEQVVADIITCADNARIAFEALPETLDDLTAADDLNHIIQTAFSAVSIATELPAPFDQYIRVGMAAISTAQRGNPAHAAQYAKLRRAIAEHLIQHTRNLVDQERPEAVKAVELIAQSGCLTELISVVTMDTARTNTKTLVLMLILELLSAEHQNATTVAITVAAVRAVMPTLHAMRNLPGEGPLVREILQKIQRMDSG